MNTTLSIIILIGLFYTSGALATYLILSHLNQRNKNTRTLSTKSLRNMSIIWFITWIIILVSSVKSLFIKKVS